MFIKNIDVVFQEVPGEISIAISVAGCPLRCHGCHSPELWTERGGTELSQKAFQEILDRYKGMATCVLFLGGEWREDSLVSHLKLAKENDYLTCLYTGENSVSDSIKENLDFLKTGKWIESNGGLESKETNQVYINCKTSENLNKLFWSK